MDARESPTDLGVNTMRRNILIIAAVVFGFMSSSALAQNRGWFDAVESEGSEQLFNITYPGGSAPGYIRELAEFGKDRFNIIVVDDVLDIQLPRIQVKNVREDKLFNLPYELTGGELVFEQMGRSVPRGMRSGQPSESQYFVTYLVKRGGNGAFRSQSHEESHRPEITIDFAGGTLLDYIEKLRETYPQSNIIAMSGAERVSMPPVVLQNVSVGAALEAIGHQTIVVDDTFAEIDVSSWLSEDDGFVNAIYRVNVSVEPEEVKSEVWSVGELVELGVTEEDLLSAVQAVLDLNDQKVTLRYHPETKLMMARGPKEALWIVSNTISRVRQSAWDKNKVDSYPGWVNNVQDLEQRMARMEKLMLPEQSK